MIDKISSVLTEKLPEISNNPMLIPKVVPKIVSKTKIKKMFFLDLKEIPLLYGLT